MKIPDYNKQYYAANRESIRATAKQKALEPLEIDKNKNAKLLFKYGITLNQYRKMLLLQNNVCAICEKEEQIDGRSLAVDHCHNTGKVRGLLCFKCNTMVGHIDKNEEILGKTITYLEEK